MYRVQTLFHCSQEILAVQQAHLRAGLAEEQLARVCLLHADLICMAPKVSRPYGTYII